MLPLHCPGEPNVVTNDCARSDGKRFRIGDVELLELGFTLPHLPQEIRENVDRELLAGTATIPETEGRIASIVADRQRLAIDDSIHRAKATTFSDACSLARRLHLMPLGSLSCCDNDLEHSLRMGHRRGMTGSDLTGCGPYSLGHEAL
jgi:hypothetical protein